jgi:hypothetical protein
MYLSFEWCNATFRRCAAVLSVLTLAVSIAGPAFAAAPMYYYTDLGPNFYNPVDINDSGQVVGSTSSGAGMYSNGSITPLGAFTPAAINAGGDVAGYGYVGGVLHAMIYRGGTLTDWTPGSAAAEFLGINDNGEAVGVRVPSAGVFDAIVYSGGSTSTVGSGYLEAINNNGQAVGWHDFGAGSTHALYSGGTWSPLGAPTGLSETGGRHWAINQSGQVAGVGYDSASKPYPVVWTTNGGVPTSAVIGSSGYAYDMNNSGMVVGVLDTGGPFVGAFVYSSDFGMVDLNPRVVNLPAGVLLNMAHAVNNRGQIAGQTVVDHAGWHPFLLTPVLPGDADADGAVNGADLNTVLSNYNQTGMDWLHGDFDGNGTVDGADLNVVLSNYNQSAGVAAAAPEPSTLLLAAAGLAGLLAHVRRKRK